MGQLRYRLGQHSAHLTYLIPDQADEPGTLLPLLDELVFRAGAMGAFNVLAEVVDHSGVIEIFRRAGFIIYARQSVWQLATSSPGEEPPANLWRSALPSEINAVRSLYNCLVPPLVQSAEPFSPNSDGLVYVTDGEVLAYVDCVFGPRGIYLLPLLHPSIDNVLELLLSLIERLSPILNRPVFMAVRSYQAWLEMSLNDSGAHSVSRQALLVKHLAHIQRVPVQNHRRMMIENKQPETSTPFVHQAAASQNGAKTNMDRVV
jgi:hypothetical protein